MNKKILILLLGLITACGKNPSVNPANPDEIPTIIGYAKVGSQAEYMLGNAGYLHQSNCIRLVQYSNGAFEVKFSSGICNSQVANSNFSVTVTTDLHLQYQGKDVGTIFNNGNGYTIPELCTSSYSSNCGSNPYVITDHALVNLTLP
jgi:hypothetical protein